MTCEAEYKGQILMAQGSVVLCLVIGLFGIGSYIKSGAADSGHRVTREPQRFVDRQPVQQLSTLDHPPAASNGALPPEYQIPAQAETQLYAQNQSVSEPAIPPSAPVAAPPVMQRPVVRVESAVYYCGAETKKGTPCARRVKGPTRCYQHVGMPAMSLAEEPAVAANKSKTR